MDVVVVLVDLPDAVVRSVRRRVVEDDLPALTAGALAGGSGVPWLVLHEPGAGGREADVEVCVPVDPGTPGAVERRGGRFAATTVRGADAGPTGVRAALEAVARHARDTGLEVVGPPRARCLGGGAVQVAWPVEEPQTGG